MKASKKRRKGRRGGRNRRKKDSSAVASTGGTVLGEDSDTTALKNTSAGGAGKVAWGETQLEKVRSSEPLGGSCCVRSSLVRSRCVAVANADSHALCTHPQQRKPLKYTRAPFPKGLPLPQNLLTREAFTDMASCEKVGVCVWLCVPPLDPERVLKVSVLYRLAALLPRSP